MTRVLALGGSSFVGRRFLSQAKPGAALGTHASTASPATVYFDPLSGSLRDLVAQHGEFSHALFLFAKSHPDYCFQHQKESYELNVTATARLLDECRELHMIPVFISSEFAFDGVKGNYTEDEPPSPILEYGRHKVAIERHLKEKFNEFVICRLAKTAGDNPDDGTLFSVWITRLLRGDKLIECAADQYFSPITVDDVARGLWELIEREKRGWYNLAGPERCGRLDLLKMLLEQAKEYGIKDIEVVERSIHDFALPERRPADVSMSPAKLVAATGIELTTMAECCAQVLQRAFRSKP